MAIDYKKEWEKLHSMHGKENIRIDGVPFHLFEVMDKQIDETIHKREKLMREYLKAGMGTDITGGDKVCHYVHIVFRKHVFGTVAVSKADFAKWCEKKGGK
jgi:hypothetical protein